MSKNFRILVLNGPNLNRFGNRESNIYGLLTLKKIIKKLRSEAILLNVKLEHTQSNAEHTIINRIHQAKRDNIDYILFNPAAFTHTSIAIRDAILSVDIPFIEIHFSNIYARESFRYHSYLSDISKGVICGMGEDGYLYALKTAVNRLLKSNKKI